MITFVNFVEDVCQIHLRDWEKAYILEMQRLIESGYAVPIGRGSNKSMAIYIIPLFYFYQEYTKKETNKNEIR